MGAGGTTGLTGISTVDSLCLVLLCRGQLSRSRGARAGRGNQTTWLSLANSRREKDQDRELQTKSGAFGHSWWRRSCTRRMSPEPEWG